MQRRQIPLLFDAGSLALDFLNTLRLRRRLPVDTLATPSDVERWLTEAGLGPLVSSGLMISPPAARTVLHEARILREEIGNAVEAFVTGHPLPVPSLFALNRVLESSRTALSLKSGADGLYVVQHETGSSTRTVLAPIAASAAELLTEADPRRIRQCASTSCVLWLLDTSKNGRRRWCSMARCGNREKAAKHYRKQRDAELES